MKSFSIIALTLLVTAAGAQTTVTMNDQKFQPARVTVTAGTKVTWVNKSKEMHTATSGTGCKGDGKWNSGDVNPGGSYSYTFQSEGTYNYFCTPHCATGMTGVVEVKSKKTGSVVPEKKKKTAPQQQNDLSLSQTKK